MDPRWGFRWRYRTSHPGFEEFVQTFRQGILVNFLIVGNKSAEAPLGYIACYRHDFHNRHAYIAVQGSPNAANKETLIEASRLFISYLFDCYDSHKLLVECPGFNFPDLRSMLDHVFVQEGCLTSYERFLGEWWDLHLLSTQRDLWLRWCESVERRRSETRDGAIDLAGAVLDETRFLAYLQRETEIRTSETITVESRLTTDLKLDSVGIFMMIAAIEDLGVAINDEQVAAAETVGDVYAVYLDAMSTEPKGRLA